MAAIQKLSQLKSRWGEHDGATIFGNSTVKVFWGGATDHEDLEAISAVCGMRDTWDHVRNPDGGKTKQPRQERAIPPERIRMLGPDQVLVLHRNTRPVIAGVEPIGSARLRGRPARPWRLPRPAPACGDPRSRPRAARPSPCPRLPPQPSRSLPLSRLARPAAVTAVPDYVPEEATPSWHAAAERLTRKARRLIGI